MEGYLTDYKGTCVKLPVVLAWNFEYGSTLPCDTFEVTFIYDKAMLKALDGAVRFRAENAGKTIFIGVVDDFEITVSEEGSLVNVHGRSLAALLLDNEAEAVQYYSASLETILNNHVYPYGITNIQKTLNIAAMTFEVDSGTSQWRVLEDFLWFGAGIRPRFSRDGVLILGKADGSAFSAGSVTAMTKLALTQKRYGVISEVLVKNKRLGTQSTVLNEPFKTQGGSCRRVVNVPRTARFDAMRATGEYQIMQSQAQARLIAITVPQVFAAFPGDTLTLTDNALGLTGNFDVYRARCFADGEKAGTELTLRAREE